MTTLTTLFKMLTILIPYLISNKPLLIKTVRDAESTFVKDPNDPSATTGAAKFQYVLAHLVTVLSDVSALANLDWSVILPYLHGSISAVAAKEFPKTQAGG